MPRAFPLAALLLLSVLGATAAARPTGGPRPGPGSEGVPVNVADPCPGGCITFPVNVHDTTHVGESADTVSRLADMFARHGVKGDFYLTGSMVELYLAQRPDVIDKLRSTGMGISYHVRAPHPLVTGFDSRLANLSQEDREAVLRDYETYRLDRTTGELDRTHPGGFALVRDTFGSAVTVAAPNSDPRTRIAALHVYKSMGAGAVMWYHEEQADLEHPLVRREGLVVRPSDIGITRWSDRGGREQFWWNKVASGDTSFDPTAHLKERLAAWTGPRGAFVTALVHENNFYRAGPEGWTFAYYADRDKQQPLPPPWTLTPHEENTVRSAAEQAAIWKAYEGMVTYAAAHLRVVTGQDFVGMAAGG